MSNLRSLLSWLLLLLALSACSSAEASNRASQIPSTFQVTATAELLTATLEIPSPSPQLPTDTPVPKLWVADYVPEILAEHAIKAFGNLAESTEERQAATWHLDVGEERPFARWVYTLVAPFPTISDGITSVELQAAWQGNLGSGPFAAVPLMMDSDTYWVLTKLWGEATSGAVKIISPDELLQSAWEHQPSWAIVSFESLDPQWKVLEIDGISPIQKDFDLTAYALTTVFGVSDGAPPINSISNYDPQKMTDVMLTGVTALVRGTALTMERKGITYPGEDIAPLTTAVDFMHVNNEIPFTPDCPFPDLHPEFLVFCSDVSYLDLLLYIGTDIVEVSGDHFGDHGSAGTLFTLDLYDENGLPYYGGGRDLEDGRKPLLIEHNGNKIAMIGCNAKGSHYYAPADENTPGAVPCDFEWLEGEIAQLKSDGYQVIMTFQHVEYYSYVAQPDLVRDFGRMAEAGADIVSGSQSHQAHGFAFQNQAFIHYGLGNLFFDQYQFCEYANCDYGFMDRHVFYAGEHISTELIPIRFIDMARPRPMVAEEKAWFLNLVFEASGW